MNIWDLKVCTLFRVSFIGCSTIILATHLSKAEDESKATGQPDSVRDSFLPGGVAGRTGVALPQDGAVAKRCGDTAR